MKKIAKLSLVASLAIAASAANAQDLSEAIKNVDVSGTVVYRYNDYETDTNADSKHHNNYKLAVNVSSKVNDDVKANTRFVAQSYGMDTTKTGDANVSVKLQEVNFTYTGVENLSVTVGKQAMNTAFTVGRDSIDTEATGTGVLAAYTMGPVTLYSAYFNQNNFATEVVDAANVAKEDGQNDTGIEFDGSEDIVLVGTAASFGGVNVDASYIDIEDKFDAYTVGLDASYDLSGVKLASFARYSALDLDNVNTDNVLWKLGVSATMGMFNAYVSYGQTDEEGGTVGMDASSATGFDEHWNVTMSGVADAETLYAGVAAQVTDKLNVALKYSDMDIGSEGTAKDVNEIYTQVVYKMSSNFTTLVRLGQIDKDDSAKQDAGRLQVQYSF